MEEGSLHLSTTSLASSSSSGSDVGSGKVRSSSYVGSDQTVDSTDSHTRATPPNLSSTGAIPKSISFDKTAERGYKDAVDSDSKHNKRGFLKNLKFPGFNKSRRKGSNRGREDRLSLTSQDSLSRRSVPDDVRPPTIIETCDDILAKYRNKKPEPDEPDNRLTVSIDSIPREAQNIEEDERLFIDVNNIEASYAFSDAKRKLRLVMSNADISMSSTMNDLSSTSAAQVVMSSRQSQDLLNWLKFQLAEAQNLNNRRLIPKLHETIRCVQLFEPQAREQLIRGLRDDYENRSPYIVYLVRSKQGLLNTLAHLDKLLSRLLADTSLVMTSMVRTCVRLFLGRRTIELHNFTQAFTQLTASDDKVSIFCKIFIFLN